MSNRVVILSLLVLAGAGLLVSQAHAQRIYIAGDLTTVGMTGSQETPPTPSPGTGRCFAVLNTAGTNLHIHIEVSGLTGPITACHVHKAAIGVAGGVVFTIPVFAGSTDIDWAIPAGSVTDLNLGLLYVNVHTAMFGGGEIRGQLEQTFDGSMNPGQETPPLVGPWYGETLVHLNETAGGCFIQMAAPVLSGPVTGSHIHMGAPGVPGAVVFPIPTPWAGSTTATWVGMTAANIADLRAGNLYANIHTALHGGGEIRGQLAVARTSVPADATPPPAFGLQVLPNPTRGSGVVRFSLPQEGDVSLRIVDVRGRIVREMSGVHAQRGANELAWDGRDGGGARVPSGVYFTVLATPAGTETRRLVVMR